MRPLRALRFIGATRAEARIGMHRPVRDVLAAAFAALLLSSCASTGEVASQEGQVAFRAGVVPPGPASTVVVPGPAIRRAAMLVPGYDPAWQPVWVDKEGPGLKGGSGAYAGLLAGLGFVQAVPMAVMTWPIAAGIIVGMAAMGTVGEVWNPGPEAGMDAADRAAILEAVSTLQPERLLRESTAEALRARTGQRPVAIPRHGEWGPVTPGTDPLAEARERGAEGVLEVTVEAFGLALAAEADLYGVFVRARARLTESAGGRLRYERVLEHGPGRPLPGLPAVTAHTLGMLAVDSAQVFRYEVQDVIARMARILAEDPALPHGPR